MLPNISFSFESIKSKVLKEKYCVKNDKKCKYVIGKQDKSEFDEIDHVFFKQHKIAYNWIDYNNTTCLIFPQYKSKVSPDCFYSGACHYGRFFIVENKFNTKTKSFLHLSEKDKAVLKKKQIHFIEDSGDVRFGDHQCAWLDL